MSNDEEKISSEQFFDDMMRGFEEASQFARGQTTLRVTRVDVKVPAPETTVLKLEVISSTPLSNNRVNLGTTGYTPARRRAAAATKAASSKRVKK